MLLLSLVNDWECLFISHLLLVLKVFKRRTVPLPGPACRVLENVSISSSSPTLRLILVWIASTMVKFIVTLVQAYLDSVWTRHGNHTTWMRRFRKPWNVFAISIVCYSKGVIEGLNSVTLHERLVHCVVLWSVCKRISNLLLLDPCNLLFRLDDLTVLLMCIQIHDKNHVTAILTLTAAFRLFF